MMPIVAESWFETLTGVSEVSPEFVRSHLRMNKEKLEVIATGESFQAGRLQIPSLKELRQQTEHLLSSSKSISLHEVVANVKDLHLAEENVGALFQAASQFNLLEMIDSEVTPEEGVGIYENDMTQGPACAIACGAGTIFRNYFVEVNGRIGQTHDNQIDCLEDIGTELGNKDGSLWIMKNGYMISTEEKLQKINMLIGESEEKRNAVQEKLRIGLQMDTEVLESENTHTVTQAYCSALPVAYQKEILEPLWEPFASLILEATYEATLLAALLNKERTGNSRVFLTTVGGSAFGNHPAWIMKAMKKAIQKVSQTALDIKIVSFRSSSDDVQRLISLFTF